MNKIWLKHYPEGVPAEIDPNAYCSLIHLFDESCRLYSDKAAFYNLGSTLSYQTLNEYTYQVAAYFQQVLSLKKGDRVAIMMPNLLQYPVILFGALRAGLIVVNVNPLYTVSELIHQLHDSGAETIVVLENYAHVVEKALAQTLLKHIIITQAGDLLPKFKAFCLNFLLKYLKRAIPRWHIPHVIFFKSLLEKKLIFQSIPLIGEDIAFLQYTGGTTGVAKGAMLTHKNLVANILQIEAWFNKALLPGSEIMITALPLYHIFSLTANCLLMIKVGGLSVLITNPRDISSVIKEMMRFKFTSITAVNTLFNALLNHKRIKKVDFSALRLSIGGGMAVQQHVAERWQSLTGIPVLEGYGLTEASPCVAINPPNLRVYSGYIGLPIPSTDVCILSNDKQSLSVNEAGELAVSGPQVMLGFWNNPKETEKAFFNHWLLTGDMAMMNEQGFIRLLERKKDMIIVSGFNVYPNEIEAVLVKIPGVLEAAVIGVPDEKSGEAVKAFIVKSNQKLTAGEIISQCKEVLTLYKVPKHIEFRQALPKSNVGKILRRQLKTI